MGLAAARELRRRGHSVAVLERAQPGRAASWASAGIIGATVRDESDPSFSLRQVSRKLWPAFAQGIHAESGLDPEYRELGCLQLATDDAELTTLRIAARRLAGGPDAGMLLDATHLNELEPTLGPNIAGGPPGPGASRHPPP